ncbi:MAG: hypothetical protein WC291_11060, partial [Thermodesulfovibrionales bacterium]
SGEPAAPQGGKAGLEALKTEALSFFEPVTARVVSADGDTLKIDKGSAGGIKTGMRLQAFKEGAPFIHPVTKEALGRVELPIGEVEVTEISSGESVARIIKGNRDDYRDAKVKIRGTKIRVVFSQGNVEWFLGDGYYQMLKDSGRFELLDTGLTDLPAITAEAQKKGADIVLALSSTEAADRIALSQKLFWAGDSRLFSERTETVETSYVKELRAASGIFMPKEGEALLSYQLPYSAKRLTMGDIEGDGQTEILIASGDTVRVYNPGVDLKPLREFSLPSGGEVLWLEALDLNADKKDEIIITSIRGNNDVSSSVFALRETGFVQISRADAMFLRTLRSGLIGQSYTRADGFDGDVFSLRLSGDSLVKGEPIPLPAGVDIYGFQLLASPDGKKAVLAWDENGFLNLYNDKGIRTWVSREELGGFPLQFKREAPTIMAERGKWSVKDRLASANGEVIAPRRNPLLGVAKGLGYKSSSLIGLWWNGINVEERSFLPEIGGEIMDYAVTGDRLVVLSRPLFGMRAQNILKGESPFGTMLYIFSLSGR